MTIEINPVLAGKWDAKEYAAATTGINANASVSGADASTSAASSTSASTQVADATSVGDSRRYTQFDRTITDAGTATMSFGDFLDMVNPLQHIPVVSSIYRAVTGETINPVSRVAGDILYGGAIGAASAVIGGIGAIANASVEQETGKDGAGVVVAALFGSDDTKSAPVQVADASKAATPVLTSTENSLQTSALTVAQNSAAPNLLQSKSLNALHVQVTQAGNFAPMAAALQVPALDQSADADISLPKTSLTQSVDGSVLPPLPVAASAASAVTAVSSTPDVPGTIAMATGTAPGAKQPFGGVMSTASTQTQDMAASVAGTSPMTRMGHTIYTGKMNGGHALAPMLSSGSAAPSTQAATAAPTPAPAASTSPGMPTPGLKSNIVLPQPTLPLQTTSDAATISQMYSSMNPSSPSSMSPNPMAAYLSSTGNGQKNALPPELIQDMMMKAASQYKAAAAGAHSPGASLDVTN
jgi:hypothetical protein